MGISILKTHLLNLNRMTHERRAWLALSAFIIVTISFLVFDSKELIEHGVLWPLAIFGILISAAWWYWVMRTIRLLLQHEREEVEVLISIVEDVKEIKEEIREVTKSLSK